MRWLALFLFALPLFGDELCWFRAGDDDDPFRRWLTSQEVTCGVAPPAGTWNVFARTANAISLPTVGEGDRTLLPAASLKAILPEAHTAVVYVPRLASAFPLSGERTLVPAGEPLWLLVLDRAHAIASIVPIAAIEASNERAIDARSGALAPSVIGWVSVPESDREVLRKAADASPPQIHIGALNSDPLPRLASLHGAFVLVRGVSAGETQLELGGRSWMPHRARAKVGAQLVTSVKEPLFARPTGSLLVNWSAAVDLGALDSQLGSCDPSKDPPARFEITISACAKPDSTSCRVVNQQTFGAEVPFGSFVIDDLAPGTYRAELRFGKLPPVRRTTQVPALQQRRVSVMAAYETLYGSVNVGDVSLLKDATIHFPGGGVGFWSNDEDEYFAVLPVDVEIERDSRIDVAACKGGLKAYVVTDERVIPRRRFDLNIPDNSLELLVTDTFTGMPLQSPTIRYTVMTKLVPRRPLFTEPITAKDEGSFIVRRLPEREIRVTVAHTGYQKRELEPFTMTKSEHKTLDVQLVPLRGSLGRILSPLPFEDGVIIWMSREGTESERVDLAPDGTFMYANRHEAGETMAVVSSSHPLWVTRTPALALRQTIEIPFPNAPARSFEVAIRGDKDRANTYIGIVIGGILVPQSALRAHQTARNLQALVRERFPVEYRDLAETGPIEVILGPTVNDIPSRGRGFDPLTLQQSLDAPRQKLMPEATEIVFAVQ